jgi:hypothetical protein
MHPFRDLMWPAISGKRFSHMQWAVDVGFSATMGTTLFVLALLAALRWTRRTAETSNPAQT